MSEKSSKKSNKPRGKPFTKADPRRMQAKGPAKGAPNAGRPKDEWKARLTAMASRDEVLDHVESVLLQGPEHPFFSRALDYVTDHGYGKAQSSVDLTSNGQTLESLLAASHKAPE